MAAQLSPAWQRKTVSSDHLAKISARFLSDAPQETQRAEACQVIPFLLDNATQHWVPQALAEVLDKRGRRALSVELPDRDTDPDTLQPEPAEASGAQPALYLLPTTDAALIEHHRLDHLVLLVPANLDAVLNAYRQIKRLSRDHTKPLEIGIVMDGPRDQHAAWRYFRKLAVGTLRYLDVRLLNLGFLPEEVLPDQGPADHHRENFLTRISERLLRSDFHCTLPTQTRTKDMTRE